MSLRTFWPRDMVSSWKISEFTVTRSMTSICFYDSLRKGGSLLLFLEFLPLFLYFLYFKKRSSEAEIIWLRCHYLHVGAYPEPQQICRNLTCFITTALKRESCPEAAQIFRGDEWLPLPRDAAATGSWRGSDPTPPRQNSGTAEIPLSFHLICIFFT